ncbi:MAG: copper amine oxidase [Clostridiaceae bacterium]|nr:copper amine oxidase [Clostridiaceae bacterium]
MSKLLKVVSALVVMVVIMISIHFSLAGGEGIKASSLSSQERLKNAIALYVGSSQAYVNNVEKQVDPENAQVKPFVKDGRTLVPVRFISESLGAEVGWDAKTAIVTVKLGGKIISLVVGGKTMKAGNKSIELDVAAQINDGRTYLPLRALAEALGKKVFYDRGLIVISDMDNIFDAGKDKSMIDEVIAKVNNLPVVGSYEELQKLFESKGAYNGYYDMDLAFAFEQILTTNSIDNSGMERKSLEAAPSASKATDEGSAAGASGDYSTTNIQVEGVDEADVVKTDGDYIYQVNNNRIIIIKAYDSVSEDTYSEEGMKIMSILDFKNDSFNPQEMYIDGDVLTAIGSYYEQTDYKYMPEDGSSAVKPYYRPKMTTKAIICDISDRTKIRKTREVEVEGYYVSSRKIGSILYIVANKDMNTYYLNNEVRIETPSYKDTAVSEKYIEIECPDIRYFPGTAESNYLTIAAVDVKNSKKANIQTFLGAGQNIYASTENLYVAVTNYNLGNVVRPLVRTAPENRLMVEAATSILQQSSERLTEVYKFSLDGTRVTYLNKGEVPGSILNQFSMDENDGYFRIATTSGETWGTGSNISKNNLYILDDTMNIRGKIENIAPGESIYSVRFMGDRGYIVTFKKVDPLFVIDLKNPEKPEILGKLKIPGYSDYLHPYDENHIIGFGKDSVEVYDNAYYQGMKIALFDVTDVNNPVQKFSQVIGDRGTDSELLRNHKALLFSKEKNLLAFPVTLMEVDRENSRNKQDEALMYGQFAYQGAYIYNIDLEKGFSLKGRITHLDEKDYLKAGNYYYSDRFIERILYIGNNFYTLSKGMVKANEIDGLKEVDELEIP